MSMGVGDILQLEDPVKALPVHGGIRKHAGLLLNQLAKLDAAEVSTANSVQLLEGSLHPIVSGLVQERVDEEVPKQVVAKTDEDLDAKKEPALAPIAEVMKGITARLEKLEAQQYEHLRRINATAKVLADE